MATVTIRPYTADDFDSVIRLYSSAFDGDSRQKADGFRWIQHNPLLTGETTNYLLMFLGDRLVGYWGLMPTTFYCSGVPFDGLFSQEALIDPAFRAKGLGQELLKGVNGHGSFMASLWHNEKIRSIKTKDRWVNVGFYRPLKKVYTLRGLAATAWRQDTAGKIASFVSPIPALLRERNGLGATGYSVQNESACGEEYDRFFHETVGKLGIVSERGSAILNWKYLDIPHKRYTVLCARKDGALRGYLVLRLESQPHVKKGIIVDLLVDPDEPEALEALLHRCEAVFGQEQVDFSVCLVLPEILRRVFYSRGYFAAGSRITDCCLILNSHKVPDQSRAAELAQWYLTYGDSDGDMW